MQVKQKVARVLNDPTAKAFPWVNDFLAALTLISIVALVLETVPELEAYITIFLAVEIVAVAFFTVEYILRIWAAPDRRKYIFSVYGLIDLVSIVPTLLMLTNLLFLKSARMLRIIRLLRMVRLGKIMKGRVKHPEDIENHRDIFRLNIQIYIFTLLTAVLVLGSLIYTIEAPRQHFESIPAGMLWAAEALVGGGVTGYYPETTAGQIVSILARFMGLVLLGILISVVGNIIRVWLLGEDLTKRRNRKKRKLRSR